MDLPNAVSEFFSAIVSFARANSGLVTVFGALIVFFSWIISNTLKTNYESLKGAVVNAERDSRIYDTLAELRVMLNSIASEVVQLKPDDRSRDQDTERDSASRISSIHREYSRVLRTVDYVRECNEFCGRQVRYSNAHSTKTPASIALAEAMDQASSSTMVSRREDEPVKWRWRLWRLLIPRAVMTKSGRLLTRLNRLIRFIVTRQSR